jgi:hypothetical protein
MPDPQTLFVAAMSLSLSSADRRRLLAIETVVSTSVSDVKRWARSFSIPKILPGRWNAPI